MAQVDVVRAEEDRIILQSHRLRQANRFREEVAGAEPSAVSLNLNRGEKFSSVFL